MVVYIVEHESRPDPSGEEEVAFIGVYSSRAKAEQAVARLGTRPGFVDWPEGFVIETYTVDEDHWADGFVI